MSAPAPARTGADQDRNRREDSTGPTRPSAGAAPVRFGFALRALAALPAGPRNALGRSLGRLALHFATERRRVAAENIAQAFPDWREADRDALLRAHFEHLGLTVMETAVAWGASDAVLDEHFDTRFDVLGLELLEAARSEGRGILLAGCHLLTLELCGALLARRMPLDAVQRRHDGRTVDALQTHGRGRHYGALLDKHDVRAVLRRLRDGHVVWLAADQDAGPRHGVFVPFFGRLASTQRAPARLVRLAGAALLRVDHWRDTATGRWTLRFAAIDVPEAADDEAATARITASIEAAVREHPEQYLWVHRRFKTRPPSD